MNKYVNNLGIISGIFLNLEYFDGCKKMLIVCSSFDASDKTMTL